MSDKKPLFQISKALTEKEEPKPVEKPVAEANQGLVKKLVKKVRPKTLPPLKEGEIRISSKLFDDQLEIEYEEVYYNAEGKIVDPPKIEPSKQEVEEEEESHKKEKDNSIEINLIGKAYGLCCRLCPSALTPAVEAAKAPSPDMTHAVKIPPEMAGDMKLLLKNCIDFIDKQIEKNRNAKGMWTLTLKNLNFNLKRV